MIDRAKEYAAQIEHQLGNASVDLLKLQIEAAYRAGFAQGQVEATRKEWVQPQQDKFERGMT
jgi:hypothetical protein